MRRAAKVDSNQHGIVTALRQVGASVEVISMIGGGVPDLLVGWQGQNYLIEIKNDAQPPNKQRLTIAESEWFDQWRGQVAIARNVDEVLKAIGAS